MKGFGKILVVETKLYLRDYGTVFFTLALPAIVLAVLGAIPALRQPDDLFGGQSFIAYFTPSLLVMTIATVGVSALPTVLATYRERGVLRRLGTTPASPASLLAAQLVLNLAVAVVSAVLLIVIARLAFDVPLPEHLPGFVVAFVLGTAALFALGLLVAAVSRSTRMATGLVTVVFMLTMFFGGAYLPRFLLPNFLARMGEFLPPGVQGLADAWAGSAPQAAQLAIMAAVALVSGAVAAKIFRWE